MMISARPFSMLLGVSTPRWSWLRSLRTICHLAKRGDLLEAGVERREDTDCCEELVDKDRGLVVRETVEHAVRDLDLACCHRPQDRRSARVVEPIENTAWPPGGHERLEDRL